MRKTTDEEQFVLTTLARSYEQSRQVLRRELGRTPTADEVMKRVVRAIEYAHRCKNAVDWGELAPHADDWGLLAEADRHAEEYAQTAEFKSLAEVLSKWMGKQDANATAAGARRNGDE